MSRRPATVTQADVARIIRAAKQAGATSVEVRLGAQATAIVRLTPDQAPSLAPTLAQDEDEIIL